MATALLKMTSQRITSRYGSRILNGKANIHKGVDFAFSLGTAVSAWGAGTVTHSAKHSEYGYYVRISHAPGISTSYHSLQKLGLPVGTVVKMGQTIGYAGKSAMGATGPHLHGGLWLGEAHVDPLKYLVAGATKAVTYNTPAASAPAAPAASGIGNTKAIQALLTARGFPCAVDNARGPRTVTQIEAFQAAMRITKDGRVGNQTWGLLALPVDGVLATLTVKTLQATIHVTPVDGSWNRALRSSPTTRAVQRHIRTPDDGDWGVISRKKFQAHLGQVQDADIAGATVRALQTRLNAGTF